MTLNQQKFFYVACVFGGLLLASIVMYFIFLEDGGKRRYATYAIVLCLACAIAFALNRWRNRGSE